MTFISGLRSRLTWSEALGAIHATGIYYYIVRFLVVGQLPPSCGSIKKLCRFIVRAGKYYDIIAYRDIASDIVFKLQYCNIVFK